MTGRHRPRQTRTSSTGRGRGLRIAAVSVLGGLTLLFLGAYYLMRTPLDQFKGVSAEPQTRLIANPVKRPADRINVLLIGTDSRPGDSSGNTDVLMLASIDNLHKRIELMSIPRDTRIAYPHGGTGKINQSLNLGGPQLTIQLVENLLQQPVDYYALTHFSGLVNIINTIGGLQVNVKERMYYNTGDQQWNLINLRPGVQTLDGTEALGFVRFRHDALGDIGRTERQQEFLAALSNKLLRPDTVSKLPTLVRQFWSTIDTNMSALEVSDIAAKARSFQNYQVIHETIPGSFHNPDPQIANDQSYWEVNPEQVGYAAGQFFESGIVQQNPVQDPSTTQNWQPPAKPSANSNATVSNQGDPDTPSVTPHADSPFLTVQVVSADVRTGPGTDYPVILKVSYGQMVKVVGTEGEWKRLQFSDGRIGYVTSNTLLAPSSAQKS